MFNIFLSLLIMALFLFTTTYAEVLQPKELLSLKSVSSTVISPDGKFAAYTVSVPREADDKPGGNYSELYVIDLKTKVIRPFITGKENVSSLAWSPDGQQIAFRMKRGEKAKTQVWSIPLSGGEARQLTDCKSGVSAFAWHPLGKQIAFIATEPESKREKALEDKIREIEKADLDSNRREKLLYIKKSQLLHHRRTKAGCDFNAAASYYNAGKIESALEMARKAALYPLFKDKAQELILRIEKEKSR